MRPAIISIGGERRPAAATGIVRQDGSGGCGDLRLTAADFQTGNPSTEPIGTRLTRSCAAVFAIVASRNHFLGLEKYLFNRKKIMNMNAATTATTAKHANTNKTLNSKGIPCMMLFRFAATAYGSQREPIE